MYNHTDSNYWGGVFGQYLGLTSWYQKGIVGKIMATVPRKHFYKVI